jgi:citrate synthase
MGDTARLILDGQEFEFPIIEGSENEKAIDISKLRAKTGHITLDLGFKNTGSTRSAITYLDGENGILRYRGYTIEELAEKASFLEVAFLLIYGELPDQHQLDYFKSSITHHTLVHENMKRFFEAFPPGAHPMGMLSSMISSLSTFYKDSQNPNRSVEDIEKTIHRLIAKLPTLAAQAYKHNMGHPTVYPSNLGILWKLLKYDVCASLGKIRSRPCR